MGDVYIKKDKYSMEIDLRDSERFGIELFKKDAKKGIKGTFEGKGKIIIEYNSPDAETKITRFDSKTEFITDDLKFSAGFEMDFTNDWPYFIKRKELA